MKNKIFLTEEESDRILNLHKKATKESRINEQVSPMVADNTRVQLPPLVSNPLLDNTPKYQSFGDAYKQFQEPTVTTSTNTAAPVVQKPVQSVNKPLVTKIQQVLKDKGISIGNTGPKKDGVDGVMGKLTLNAIIGLLGGGTTATTGTAGTTPTGTAATTPTGTAATTAPTAGTTTPTGTATKDVNPED